MCVCLEAVYSIILFRVIALKNVSLKKGIRKKLFVLTGDVRIECLQIMINLYKHQMIFGVVNNFE